MVDKYCLLAFPSGLQSKRENANRLAHTPRKKFARNHAGLTTCKSLTFLRIRDNFVRLRGCASVSGPAPCGQVTDLLLRWTHGDSQAREKLVPLVYDELRRVARRCLAGQRSDHTLQGTALVHEAYLRLVDQTSVRWENRVHFFAVAAQLMRHILVDQIRMKRAKKRGGDCVTLLLTEDVASAKEREIDLLALDEALENLAALDSRQCRIVELRFFAGLSINETSQVLDVSPATVKREWATARLWLLREMHRQTQA
jgi:RNA polymerase sigma factor (TIGR02999 family)